MAAVEKDFYPHAGRVLGRIENGHNTADVRWEASQILQKGRLSESSHLLDRLHGDLVRTWRHLGPVDDSELDTAERRPRERAQIKD